MTIEAAPFQDLPDRRRLLEHGQVKVTVVGWTGISRERLIAETWARMQASARALWLQLSEPIVRDEPTRADRAMVLTLTAGVAELDPAEVGYYWDR